jgi:hypothetical protein
MTILRCVHCGRALCWLHGAWDRDTQTHGGGEFPCRRRPDVTPEPCPYDTNGDGNCGRPTCARCHPEFQPLTPEVMPMMRPAFWTVQVKCVNPECADHEVVRTINLTQLGDGVFHIPVTMSALGVPMAALGCGTCRKQMMAEVTPT